MMSQVQSPRGEGPPASNDSKSIIAEQAIICPAVGTEAGPGIMPAQTGCDLSSSLTSALSTCTGRYAHFDSLATWRMAIP